ncbi:MAG: putative 2-aminoethylphosphonate ABC transporter ATP-binding protein [Proteobacteria bacterium]|nr:putative 2-aminoethylphosphonate ABC transporter ATP-binding protein [Pseudomonadota bacterium]
MSSEDAFLRIEDISKDFGKFHALKNINLDIRKGELVCFLGPSGCGKTTLLRIIAGLETQSSGRIVQNGRDISLLPPPQRDYGIVFQSYALFPNLSVAANVAYGLVNRKVPRAEAAKKVAELLKLVGLPGSEAKYPNQLSGGQQQRIALARALATSPGLLLLDEPLSALDALERLRLRGEVRALQQKVGVTTIMVTHDQEEALAMADRIVVMNHGVIEQVGTPLEIYREPASPFVADFVGKINVLNALSEGGGRYRIGARSFQLPGAGHSVANDGTIRIYLRPEDLLARNVEDDDPHSVWGRIQKIEFLGAFCHVRVALEKMEDQPVTVYFSLNLLDELGLAEGSRLRIRVMAERMRIFHAAQ